MTLELGKRNNSLDLLRGLAICMVLFNHIQMPPPPVSQHFTDKAFQVLTFLTMRGKVGSWTGVDLFFVLSGFLVSGLLFKEYAKNGFLNIGRFFIRRGFKIYPAFFFFLLATFSLEFILFTVYNFTLSPLAGYIPDLLFVHNYVGGRWSQTWSLDVEEHFYLLLPLIFIFWIRNRKLNFKSVFTTYICLAIIGILGRIAIHIAHPAFKFNLYMLPTHIRLDSLFFGVLISYAKHFEPRRLNTIINNKRWLMPAAFFLLLCNYIFNLVRFPWMSVITLALNPIAFGIIMVNLLHADLSIKPNNIIVFMGRYSYGIYLWHVFVNQYTPVIMLKMGLEPDIKANWFLYLAIYISLLELA